MKTLVAIQDRSLADRLMPFLQCHSWQDNSEFHVVHVVEPPIIGFHTDLALLERMRQRSEDMVASMVEGIERVLPSCVVRGHVVEGDPKEAIVKLARSLPADLIIMGSHGRGMLGRIFLGSVSLAVLTATSCSVLMLRPSQRAERQMPAESGKFETITGTYRPGSD